MIETAPKVNKSKLRREQKEAEKNAKKNNVVVQTVRVSPDDKVDIDRVIKAGPYVALDRFRNGTGEVMDWRALQFRTIVGMEILKAILNMYQVADEDAATIEQVREHVEDAVAMVGAIAIRYNETRSLHATPMEIEMIRTGMRIVDDLQDVLAEGDLLVAYRHAEMLINGKDKSHRQQSKGK